MIFFKIKLYTSEPLEKGKFPIVVQVSWRDRKAHVRRKRLGLSCSKDDWDWDNDCFKRDVWGYVKKNAKLKEYLEKSQRVYREMETWDYKQWAKLFDSDSDQVTFDQWAKQLIQEYNTRGQAGTSDHYRDAMKALQKFMGQGTNLFRGNHGKGFGRS